MTKWITVLKVCLALFPLLLPQNVLDTRGAASAEHLKALTEDVAGADGAVYGARDSAGQPMDCAKIAENPASPGEFLAVYHTYQNGLGRVCLASSANLLQWEFLGYLAGEPGANATQPTLQAVENGFLLAWEQEPNNHLALAWYESAAMLKAGRASRRFDCPRQLSASAEGTPNIISVTEREIKLGFHYYRQGKVDRQAVGVLRDWETWVSAPRPVTDWALFCAGAPKEGKTGDRDRVRFAGRAYLLAEAGCVGEDFGTWRCYLYDCVTGRAQALQPRTAGGSNNFANPTASIVTLEGKPALVCTLFIPGERAAPGEAGCCIYYHWL